MATILIVDDEQPLLDLLEEILHDGGHTVLTASDGKQALSIIESHPLDLIISDVMMPLVDGITMLRRVQANPALEGIKVMLVSAAPIQLPEDLHIDKFIPKPYDIYKMEIAVSEVLNSR